MSMRDIRRSRRWVRLQSWRERSVGVAHVRVRLVIGAVLLALLVTSMGPLPQQAHALGGSEAGVAVVGSPDGKGYAIINATGKQFNFGTSGFTGVVAGTPNAPIVDATNIPGTHDKWFAAADGGVFTLGNQQFYGSMGGQHLNAPITAIVSSRTGYGYLLVSRDGGTFAFGDFPSPGSLAGTPLNSPIVDAEWPRTAVSGSSEPTAAYSPRVERRSTGQQAARASTLRWWRSFRRKPDTS